MTYNRYVANYMFSYENEYKLPGTVNSRGERKMSEEQEESMLEKCMREQKELQDRAFKELWETEEE